MHTALRITGRAGITRAWRTPRRPQLMGGVRDESLLTRQHIPHLFRHAVERPAEPFNLVRPVRPHALGQVAAGHRQARPYSANLRVKRGRRDGELNDALDPPLIMIDRRGYKEVFLTVGIGPNVETRCVARCVAKLGSVRGVSTTS